MAFFLLLYAGLSSFAPKTMLGRLLCWAFSEVPPPVGSELRFVRDDCTCIEMTPPLDAFGFVNAPSFEALVLPLCPLRWPVLVRPHSLDFLRGNCAFLFVYQAPVLRKRFR